MYPYFDGVVIILYKINEKKQVRSELPCKGVEQPFVAVAVAVAFIVQQGFSTSTLNKVTFH